MNNKFISKKTLLHSLSFVMPILIFTLILAIKEIAPFGSNTLLDGDMAGQYTPFYTEFTEKIRSGSSLLYSWTRGLGVDYICEAGYYLISPLNIILLLFSKEKMYLAFSILIALKMGFSGLNMSLYLRKHFTAANSLHNNYTYLYFCTFSCCYSLCSYMTGYYTNIIWIDCMVIFPLIMLSLERLVLGKKPFLFSLYLGIAILTNFYIGFMICIFCIIYFIYLIAVYRTSIFSAIRNFTIYSIIAGGLGAVILIPEIYALGSTNSASKTFSHSISAYYPAVVTFFRHCMSAVPTYWHYPYLYSTVLVFLLIPVYMFSHSISLRERIGKCILVFILLLSFQINILDYLWNGGHMVNCFAGRQSFIYIFLMLTMSIEAFFNLSSDNKKLNILSVLIAIILLYISNTYFNFSSTFRSITINLFILVVYFSILIFTKYNHNYKILICICLLIEISYSAFDNINSGFTINEYYRSINHTKSITNLIDDKGFYRIKNENKTLNNEEALCDYKGISSYSSLVNDNLSDFLGRLGYMTAINELTDISDEPVSNSILGIKYIISSKEFNNSTFSLIKKSSSEYIYKNSSYLAPAFEVLSSVKDKNAFNGKNPFEVINSFALFSAGIEQLYTPLSSESTNSSRQLAVKPQTILYLYSKKELSGSQFISSAGHETLYPEINSSVSFLKTDNYIYNVKLSTYGGYIQLPDNINASDIIAYKLNLTAYNKLMNKLSANQIQLTSYTDSSLKGTLTASYNGTILTSIQYNKGWNVYVDGKPINTFSINNALLGFSIKKGKHSIQLSYMPQGLLTGSLVSIVSIILLLLLIILHLKKQKRLLYDSLSDMP